MFWAVVAFGTVVTAQAEPGGVEPGHAANPFYQALLEKGWKVGETHVELPAPKLADGASADEERATLRAVAGSGPELDEFLRDSVSARFVFKTHDLPAAGGLVRQADLWFVVRADLDAIDPDKAVEGGEGKEVEAGNMRFQARTIGPEELGKRGIISSERTSPVHESYMHLTGRLLDRVHVEATDRVAATRTEGSWVIASRTDSKFDSDSTLPNRWWPIERKGAREEPGQARPFAGGASYVKISRLATVPGALLVEAHFAFLEPKAWFDGAPVLRSKIGVVAQDRIRALRRELSKRKSRPGE
jgi:hypothetical protein